MKGTFQIVGWKGLFYRGRVGREGGVGRREEGGDEKAYLKRFQTIMHITRGGP